MDDEHIRFELQIDIPELKSVHPAGEVADIHDAELIISDKLDLTLKIFFSGSEYLDEKIMTLSEAYRGKIVSKFIATKVVSPSTLFRIEFLDVRDSGMKSVQSDGTGSRTFFTIALGGVRLYYQSDNERDSFFYLNKTAFSLVELHYRYNHIFSWTKEPFTWQPKNSFDQFSEFGGVEFLLEHHMFPTTKQGAQTVSFEKEPRIRIKHSGHGCIEILRRAMLLCDLYSFYMNKRVDFGFANIYSDGVHMQDIRSVDHEETAWAHGLFIWKFRQKPALLINNVNAAHLLENQDFISLIIQRFNYALETSGETKFMILYSILEQLRNRYVDEGKLAQDGKSKVAQQYEFTATNEGINASINNFLQTLEVFVIENQQALFGQEISSKVKQIKLMSMTNQFDSFFGYLDIDVSKYSLDFKKLLSLRNTIFHGDSAESSSFVEEICWYEHLPMLVGTVMLKYFGISDLESIATDPRVRKS